MKKFIALATICLVAACGAEPEDPAISDAAQIIPETDEEIATRIEARRILLSDSTMIAYDGSHGLQIEYLSADGEAFLWYPGNQRIVSGEWKLEKSETFYQAKTENGWHIPRLGYFKDGLKYRAHSKICYRYTGNTYNPVTKQRGGNWQCSGAPLLLNHKFRSTVSGDPFNLSEGKSVPFILKRKDRSELRRIRDILNLPQS